MPLLSIQYASQVFLYPMASPNLVHRVLMPSKEQNRYPISFHCLDFSITILRLRQEQQHYQQLRVLAYASFQIDAFSSASDWLVFNEHWFDCLTVL